MTNKPIYVQATNSVDDGYVDATLDALSTIDSTFEPEIDYRNVSGWTPSKSDYQDLDADYPEFSSPEWYEQESLVDNRGRDQVDAGRLKWLLDNEPWREAHGEHVDVFLTGEDLTGRGQDGELLNYVMGGADSSENPSTVILSSHRIEKHPRTSAYETETPYSFEQEVFQTLALHEFGHLFGAPDGSRGRNLDYSFEGQAHCGNEDVMRPGFSVDTLVDQTIDRLETGRIYCGDCAGDIKRTLEE